jgi:hypothetical protein
LLAYPITRRRHADIRRSVGAREAGATGR